MKKIMLLLFAAALSGSIYAQDSARTISGVVNAADDAAAVENVTIRVKGSDRISGTHPDGAFYIDVTKKDSVLVFHCQGYEKKEIKVTKSCDYKVVLKKKAGLQMEYRPLVKRTAPANP